MAGSPTELQSMLRTQENPNSEENWKAMEVKLDGSGKSDRINGCAKLVDGVIVKVADGKDEKGEDDRETWGSKVDFLLSIIGFAVDLANVWRFPYLCYRNGGGAFLIPYFLMLFFGALPLFFMELAVGQFHGAGAISVWRIAPVFKGVGWAACLMAFYVAFYYNVIIAWALFYLGSSFTSVLPWTTCNNVWNTFKCNDGSNITDSNTTLTVNRSLYNTPAEEFFERGVLGLQHSDGIHDLGEPRWQLVLSLMGVFVILYFSLWKGVKSSGKVVWVTATMPYLVLSILLVRGVMLPGAREGILYFITPRLDRLAEKQVWIDAAVQIFYSTGVGFGTHLAYSSYNKFNNNCYRDCLCTAGVNTFTSLFSGFVIFSYLGYMAQKQNVPLAKVADEGPGLVFIVYPEAIATLPGSVGWSIIFFIMLLTLGLDSAFGGLESVLTGLQDEFKWFFRRFKHSREIFTAVVISAAFLVALANVTTGGMYLLTIQDTFAAGTSLLFTVLIQSIGLSWFYGLKQFSQDIEQMLGFKPALFWRICWKFVSPIFLGIVVLSSVITYTPLEYKGATGHYSYPTWANAVGWLIGLSSMLLIPIVAIYQLIKTKGTLSERFAIVISPEWEHQAIRNGQPVKRYQVQHWVSI